MDEVCSRYGLSRAGAQGLQERCARFAGCAAAFCDALGWADLESLLSRYAARALHGVRPEVLALTEVPFVGGHTARALFAAGLRTVEALAALREPGDLEAVLAAAGRGRWAGRVLAKGFRAHGVGVLFSGSGAPVARGGNRWA